MEGKSSLTRRLQELCGGNRELADEVLREILPKLRQIAMRQLGREQGPMKIRRTELINELWIRNLRAGSWRIESREHFFNIAAEAMRRVIIDIARSRKAGKRNAGETDLSLSDLGEAQQPTSTRPEEIIELGILMDELEKLDPEVAHAVDRHYFAGFTLEEISEASGVSLRRVRNRWERGRNWLAGRLKGSGSLSGRPPASA